MSARNAGLTADPLFVGATRPPMRWGVTYAALLFNLVFTLGGVSRDRRISLTLLVCVPIHGVCALLCARDARFFDLLLLWGRTRCRHAGHAAPVAGEQLQPAVPRSADARGRRRRAGPVRGWAGDRLPVLSAARRTAVRRERTAAEHIPYTAHVAPEVVKTRAGDYLQVFRLAGASFESADDEQLNTWHERLNVLWRNLASPGSRSGRTWCGDAQPASMRPTPQAASPTHSTAGYCARLAGETLMVNELYLTLCYRPAAGLAAGALARLRVPARAAQPELELAEALERCAKLRADGLRLARPSTIRKFSRAYRCGRTWCSSLLEYLAQLVNGEWQRVPLPEGPVSEALATARLLFGTEAIEYRTARRDPCRGVARHQGIPDAHRGRDVRPPAVRAVSARAHAVVRLPVARPPRRVCCSGSSTAWPTPATSRSRRRRS